MHFQIAKGHELVFVGRWAYLGLGSLCLVGI
jgi:hypothetical protein